MEDNILDFWTSILYFWTYSLNLRTYNYMFGVLVWTSVCVVRYMNSYIGFLELQHNSWIYISDFWTYNSMSGFMSYL